MLEVLFLHYITISTSVWFICIQEKDISGSNDDLCEVLVAVGHEGEQVTY